MRGEHLSSNFTVRATVKLAKEMRFKIRPKERGRYNAPVRLPIWEEWSELDIFG